MKKIDYPLEQGIFVKQEESLEEVCILVLYEKLPTFCYACGRLGHIVRDCEDASVNKVNMAFGAWLNAPSP